jgi:hypothetical protein
MADERFELSLLGGAVERRYRKLRPDIDRIPWRNLERARFTDAQREAGRKFWTANAMSEHAAAAGCSAVVRALVEARAPLDLVAVESTFVLDEIAHAEMAARIANALGGGVVAHYDADVLVPEPPRKLSRVARAVDLAVMIHCINEAFLLPLARAMIEHQPHPVMRTALRRIVKDEAAHARFGWIILDWADELLDDNARELLRRRIADRVARQRAMTAAPPRDTIDPVGWLPSDAYARLAPETFERNVCAPLRERGLL